MSIKDKKGFKLYHDMGVIVDALNDKQAGQLLKAIFGYVNMTGYEIEDPVVRVVFLPIKQALDRDHEQYIDQCNRNRENANKRWHANASDGMRTDANGCEVVPSYAKNADKDKDKDKDKDTKIKSPQPPQGAKSVEIALRLNFEQKFWSSVIRKIGKGQALKAFLAAYRKHNCQLSPEDLAAKYNAHVTSKQEVQYSKHPATWLNAIGWEDEEATQSAEGKPAAIEAKHAEPADWKEIIRHGGKHHYFDRHKVEQLEETYGSWDNIPANEQRILILEMNRWKHDPYNPNRENYVATA